MRAEGIVDSLGFVRLITDLEARLGFEIDLADLAPEDLTVVGAALPPHRRDRGMTLTSRTARVRHLLPVPWRLGHWQVLRALYDYSRQDETASHLIADSRRLDRARLSRAGTPSSRRSGRRCVPGLAVIVRPAWRWRWRGRVVWAGARPA